jgi:hypothetical protein
MRSSFSAPDDQLLLDYCDAPRNWGPLLFLRPAPKERLGVARTLVLSGLLGGLFGVIGNVLLFLFARALHRPCASPYAFPGALTAIYFLACRVSIVPPWNRRAERLSSPSG